jgi:hypothetical protein
MAETVVNMSASALRSWLNTPDSVTDTRGRRSLMNWGHDPLKD